MHTLCVDMYLVVTNTRYVCGFLSRKHTVSVHESTFYALMSVLYVSVINRHIGYFSTCLLWMTNTNTHTLRVDVHHTILLICMLRISITKSCMVWMYIITCMLWMSVTNTHGMCWYVCCESFINIYDMYHVRYGCISYTRWHVCYENTHGMCRYVCCEC